MGDGVGKAAPGGAEAPGAAALADRVRARALELGFDLVGVTTPDASWHMDAYRDWLAAGRHGEMAYLARPDAVARREALEKTLAGVRSVVVVGHEYFQEDPEGVPDDSSRGVIARYARGRDYHKVVKKRLTTLGRWLEQEVAAASGPGASAEASGAVAWRAYVDTGPILERELARRAGLGWFGKNTMLIHPRKGSYFFLGVLLTDVELAPDEPFTADFCGSCTACLDACPTGALLGRDEHGAPVLDANLCISYLTIEHRGAIPAGLRPAMGNRIYGCDVCQEVCPWNERFAQVAAERAYAPREAWDAVWDRDGGEGVSAETSWGEDPLTEAVIPTTDGPALVDLMRMGQDEWDAYTRGSALRRAGYAGFLRNVAVALGNRLAGLDVPDAEAMGVLVGALEDEDRVVAETAAWALGRVGATRV
ncbi:MAG: tRNA epoxyqueuosine(34) reductase QueG [Gemmatimonadota bacterium]